MKFTQIKSGYWYSTRYPKKTMQRAVWLFYRGEIPDKYHVHHLDGNRSNNNILNLTIISPSKHQELHSKKYISENKEKFRAHLDKIRPLTKVWHRSQEGREFKRKRANNQFKNAKKIKSKCLFCSLDIEYTEGFKKKRFCGQKCSDGIRKDQIRERKRNRYRLLHEGRKERQLPG